MVVSGTLLPSADQRNHREHFVSRVVLSKATLYQTSAAEQPSNHEQHLYHLHSFSTSIRKPVSRSLLHLFSSASNFSSDIDSSRLLESHCFWVNFFF